ncbi:MAG: spore germination protein [Defluviitaleaceae bacterium]|nr:spore germination protein [Defluviitaleaceae bacterium]
MDLNAPHQQVVISELLDVNVKKFKKDFGDANDFLVREVTLQDAHQTKAAIIGIDGLVNGTDAQDFIIGLLTVDLSIIDQRLPKNAEAIFDVIYHARVSMFDANKSNDVQTLYDNILTGHVIVLIDGVACGMIFDCKGWPSRGIGTPMTEKSLWGPKDSFVETIRLNTALLRRRLRDPRLRFDVHAVGRMTKTDVFVAHIAGLTNPEFVKLANDRIKAIDIDTITNAYELIQLIEDKHHSLLPRLIETERPDRVMKALSEGQVAIFVDGSPYAIIGPFYFTSAFSAIDDYYNQPLLATVKRSMRYFAFFAIILIPGLYIALSTFHQEMIPTSLLITIINQRSANPFSTFVEIFIVVILFEIIREASLRKPDAIGDSMTIVGSLIMGTTIIESGLVSYAAIIVGSITTISSFLLSNTRINTAARLYKIVFMVIGSTFGFYGITLLFIILMTHMVSLTSFNQAYLAPMAPFNLSDQKDQLIKLPVTWMKKRPKIFAPLDPIRSNLTPQPAEKKGGTSHVD